MDDKELEHATKLLQIVMSDLWVDLVDPDDEKRDMIKRISSGIAQIDQRIRACFVHSLPAPVHSAALDTDVRGGKPARHKAKNALTRLQHMLVYRKTSLSFSQRVTSTHLSR